MKSLINFIYELSVLKKLPRSGSFIAGIQNPDTVGAHVFRATQVAFLLAEMEGGNGERAAFLVSLHDNAECRIGDHHKIMNRYIPNKKDFEAQAFYDQISDLPTIIQTKMQSAWEEFEVGKTTEAKAAKDADLLELAFEANERLQNGYTGKQNWLDNIKGGLKTSSAQKIFAQMITTDSNEWWQGLKKL